MNHEHHHKNRRRLQQLSDDKFYKPLTNPIVLNTAQKVNRIVNELSLPGNIDTMTQMVNNRP